MSMARVCFILVFFSLSIQAQVPYLKWANNVVSQNYESRITYTETIPDNDGNIITVATFQDTYLFQSESDNIEITTNGELDVFISKRNTSGDLLWVKSIGGISWDEVASVEVDALNNIYVAGFFTETVDFDPSDGNYSLTSNGIYDYFILKLNSSGEFIWVKQIGGIDHETNIKIHIDGNGRLFAGGTFNDIVDFDPSIGEEILTAVGEYDMFLLQLNLDGELQWVKHFEGVDTPIGNKIHKITSDVSGNLYIVGKFHDVLDFDTGPESFELNAHDGSSFVLKMDSEHNFLWVKQLGGLSPVDINDIDVDINGNIYCAGEFRDFVDFNPNYEIAQLDSYDAWTQFIFKWDSNGSFIWVLHGGVGGNARCNSMDIDENGFVYLTGEFSGTADLDPSSSVMNFTADDTDIFIQKIDSNGETIWVNQFNGTSYDDGHSIFVDGHDNIFLVGLYDRAIDYNPGEEEELFSEDKYSNLLVLKLGECTPTSDNHIITKSICFGTTYQFGSQLLTMPGTYCESFLSNDESDSTVMLTLFVDNVIQSDVANVNGLLYASPNADNYEWVSCDANETILGTGQTFAPELEGSYAVKIYKNDCVVESTCIDFSIITGISDYNNDIVRPSVYPNPTNDQIFVDLEGDSDFRYYLYDYSGQIVEMGQICGGEVNAISLVGNRGIYLLKTIDKNGSEIIYKVIKE